METRVVGKSKLRKEGLAKLTGKAQYIDDIKFPEMIYGVTVRSPVARGKIKNIKYKPGVPWDEITVVTAKDIPGKNVVAVIDVDQPLLATEFVNHVAEPILLLAHPDKYIAEKARQLVEIEIEPLPGVFTIDESLAKKAIIWGKDNIFKIYKIEKGNPDSVWKTAFKVVEGEYETGAQEQLYIENHGVIAVANAEDGVTVWGSLQCPYYVHKGLISMFGLPAEKIRVIQTETGGGFGGKEEYPTVISGHAALLAWKSKKPVKMIYSRTEDMAATTKRHPSRTRVKTAHDQSGRLLAMEIEFTLDGGAYLTLTPVVLSRGTIHSAGPYSCDNVRVTSKAVATNYPPHGAFRGFGAPQSIFAFERHMDVASRTFGISPLAIRQVNLIKKGQTTATGQVIKEDVQFDKIVEIALRQSDYEKKIREFAEHNKRSPVKKGIGLATFMHGAGFTGSGEAYLASVAAVEGTSDGRVRVLVANTEIGQGANTMFAQVTAEALGLEYESIEIAQPDTKFVPNSGPTVASRTCMIVGALVERAALGLKQTLIAAGVLREPYSPSQFLSAIKTYVEKFGALKSYANYKQPEGVHWDDQKYSGEAYAAYAWACYVAEVSVDSRTFETHVDDFVAVQEVGRVINPTLAEGQIEGGVAQGIGYAIYEKVVYKDGQMLNNQMTNYIMPTAADVPDIRVYFEEWNRAHGPQGAKGIGELPLDGPAPAILNAIENATGVSMTAIPVLPEDLMREWKKKGF